MWRRRLGVVVLGAALVAAGLGAVHSFSVVSVAGGSMAPALLPADVVLVMRTRDVSRGDIALLASPSGSRYLHRIVHVDTAGSVETRGDANEIDDFDPTPRGRILGRVVRVVPAGTVLMRWRRSRLYATLTAQ
ncbi:MAG TPA: S24/S26 family peptidase [Coriobacteriia bacterium]|nr:S24/S26 family peptidase [Coriobacteriia bacterium]